MFDLSEKTDEELWELTTAEEVDSRAMATHELAMRCARSGRDEQVPSLFGATIDIWKADGNALGAAMASFAFAGYLVRNESYDEALPLIAEAVATYEAEAKDEWLADAYRQQAYAYRGLKDGKRALQDFATAIEIYADGDFDESAAGTWLDVVELLGSLDRQDEALAATVTALKYAESAQEPELSIRVHDRAAAALIDLGEYDLALERLRQAIDLAVYLADFDKLNYQRSRLGATLVTRGKFAEALPHLDRAVEYFRKQERLNDVADVDTVRLACLFELGRTSEAEELVTQLEVFTAALQFTRMRALIHLVCAGARVAEENFAGAEELHVKAVELAKEADDDWLLKVAQISWAETLLEEGKFAAAFDLVKEMKAEDWGQNRVMRTRLLSVRAASRSFIEMDSISVERGIQECLAMGNAIGFARAHGRCFAQLSIIRRGEGRIADAKTLMASALALYLRAGLTTLAQKKVVWLMPDGYLVREALGETNPL